MAGIYSWVSGQNSSGSLLGPRKGWRWLKHQEGGNNVFKRIAPALAPSDKRKKKKKGYHEIQMDDKKSKKNQTEGVRKVEAWARAGAGVRS